MTNLGRYRRLLVIVITSVVDMSAFHLPSSSMSGWTFLQIYSGKMNVSKQKQTKERNDVCPVYHPNNLGTSLTIPITRNPLLITAVVGSILSLFMFLQAVGLIQWVRFVALCFSPTSFLVLWGKGCLFVIFSFLWGLSDCYCYLVTVADIVDVHFS